MQEAWPSVWPQISVNLRCGGGQQGTIVSAWLSVCCLLKYQRGFWRKCSIFIFQEHEMWRDMVQDAKRRSQFVDVSRIQNQASLHPLLVKKRHNNQDELWLGSTGCPIWMLTNQIESLSMTGALADWISIKKKNNEKKIRIIYIMDQQLSDELHNYNKLYTFHKVRIFLQGVPYGLD